MANNFSLNINVAKQDGYIYTNSKMNDIIISCKLPLLFGDTNTAIVMFKNQKMYISQDIIPLNSQSVCFGEQQNPLYNIHTQSINTTTCIFQNTNNALNTYTPIDIMNNASNMQTVTQLKFSNGSNKCLNFLQNGPCNLLNPNAAFIQNAIGDLHIGGSNMISVYKSGSLSNSLCIGVSPSSIPGMESNVGTAGSYKLVVNGLAWSAGWRTISDTNKKDNVMVIENACDKVSRLSGYTYNLKSDSNIRCAGLMAQEVNEILPEVVDVMFDGSYSLDYSGVIALLVEAIKELNQKV